MLVQDVLVFFFILRKCLPDLCRNLLSHHGKHLGLDSRRVPGNMAVSRFAEALAKAWKEYNNPRFENHIFLVFWISS